MRPLCEAKKALCESTKKGTSHNGNERNTVRDSFSQKILDVKRVLKGLFSERKTNFLC
jgi:hypothetical protein